MKRVSISILLGITLAGAATIASASRNTAGTYSLPGSAFVSGTTISSSAMNAKFADIESALTDSLSRTGKGGMTSALRLSDGSAASPALAFTSETGSGLYRIGASDLGLAVNGVRTHEWQASGETVTGTLAVSGAATLSSTLAVTGASTLTGGVVVGNGTIVTNTAATKLYLKGNLAADSTDADVVVDTPVQRTAGNLLSLRNLGGEKVIVDYSGRVTVAAPTDSAHAATKGYVDGKFIVALRVKGSDGSILAQTGSVTATAVRGSAGSYTVTVPGITVNAIVICTANNNVAPTVTTTAMFAGAFGALVTKADGTAIDGDFSCQVLAL